MTGTEFSRAFAAAWAQLARAAQADLEAMFRRLDLMVAQLPQDDSGVTKRTTVENAGTEGLASHTDGNGGNLR